MKKIIYLLLILLSTNASAQNSELIIRIYNIDKGKGTVVVDLYDTAEDWLEKPYRRQIIPADESRTKIMFEVPTGTYGITVYQDEDADGKLDAKLFGIPKERIGFGNNHRPLGEPKFDASTIEHSATTEAATIQLYKVALGNMIYSAFSRATKKKNDND